MGDWNQNSGYGQALLGMAGSVVPAFGSVHVVFNSSNSDEKNYQILQEVMTEDPLGRVRFFTSLESAYTEVESNNNDVILLDANSSHAVAAQLDVTKNRIHFVGMDGGHRLIQQGAKVVSTDAAADAAVMKNTGTRNSFINIKFIQVDTNAAAINVVQDGSEGVLYKNCSFTFGVIDNLDLATATEFLAGTDSGTWIDCMFGADTLLTSAARTVFKIDQVTASQEFKSNVLKDCVWQISSSDASAKFISMAAAGDILFTNLFIRPIFQASVDSAGGVALDAAVTTANGTTKGTINLYMPCGFNVTNVGTNGTNNDNLQVYGPSFTTGTDLVGVAPVAT